MSNATCNVSGCLAAPQAKSMCAQHFAEAVRWAIAHPKASKAPAERLWDRIEYEGDCWRWTGSRYSNGYGMFSVNRHYLAAHRLSYEIHEGPVPPGHFLDHICHNRLCVNPSHLRPVTAKQNIENYQPDERSLAGMRGVYWDKRRQRWYVQVRHNYTKHHGGTFRNLEDAKAAALELRLQLHTHNDADRAEAS